MEALLDVLSWIAIVGGLFFMLVGTIGVLRMPDVYTRIHGAGMTDTLGAGLLILGMTFQSGLSLLTVRLLFVLAFLFFTSPVGGHALSRAARLGGVEPWRAPTRGG
jgi:multicomponent Na+:H+ antiporter subunit G